MPSNPPSGISGMVYFFNPTGMKKYFFLSLLFPAISVVAQPAAGYKSADVKSADYYMMKNDNVIHFLSTGEAETVMTNATLLNGTIITSSGDVVTKKGV